MFHFLSPSSQGQLPVHFVDGAKSDGGFSVGRAATPGAAGRCHPLTEVAANLGLQIDLETDHQTVEGQVALVERLARPLASRLDTRRNR
jgi:hypothetical protein